MIVLMLLMSMAATAHDADGNLTVITDYRSRGISQTHGHPALHAQIEYTHDTGAWIGTRMVNVSRDTYVGGRGIENDIYGGYMRDFGNGYRIYVGNYQYVYSRAHNTQNARYDTNEIFTQLRAGAFTLKFYHSLTDYFGLPRSSGTNYVSMDYYLPLHDNFTFVAHGGYTRIANHSHLNYTDLRIGLAYEIKPITYSATIYDNQGGRSFREANTVQGYRAFGRAVVFSASWAF